MEPGHARDIGHQGFAGGQRKEGKKRHGSGPRQLLALAFGADRGGLATTGGLDQRDAAGLLPGVEARRQGQEVSLVIGLEQALQLELQVPVTVALDMNASQPGDDLCDGLGGGRRRDCGVSAVMDQSSISKLLARRAEACWGAASVSVFRGARGSMERP